MHKLDDRTAAEWFFGGNLASGAGAYTEAVAGDEAVSERADRAESGIIYMRLRSVADHQLTAIPAEASRYRSLRDWLPGDAPRATVENAPGTFYFRYSPVRDSRSDFLLWYWHDASSFAEQPSGQFEIRLRWLTSSFDGLVWESEPIFVDCEPRNWWTPIVVPMPLWPKQAAHLRFEVLACALAHRVPLATGIVVASGDQEYFSDVSYQPDADAVALTYVRSGAVLPVSVIRDKLVASNEPSNIALVDMKLTHTLSAGFSSVALANHGAHAHWMFLNCHLHGSATFFRLPPEDSLKTVNVVLPSIANRPLSSQLWHFDGVHARRVQPLI